MKKYLFYSISLLNFYTYAQPTIQWQKAIGGLGSDVLRSAVQTSDGGYIIAGNSTSVEGDISGNHGGSDAIVVKISSSGLIEWQKSYGGSGNDSAESIQKTTDGGYIIAGATSSVDGDVIGNHGLGDFWVVKITHDGILQWQKCLGGSNGDNAKTIYQTPDGGYVVGGTTASSDGDVTGNHNNIGESGNSDYWVVKLTGIGNIVWQKCVGSFSSDYFRSMILADDGGYVAIGDAQANGGDVTGHHGDLDYWVVKLNGDGEIEWQKALGGTDWDSGRGVTQNSEGDFVVVGYSSSNNGDVTGTDGSGDGWVVKLDATGNIIWQKALGGTGSDFLYSVKQTTDGGYILAGDTTSNDGDASGNHGNDTFDYWAIKLSAVGDVQWHKLLGGTDNDTALSIIQATSENFLISGYSHSTDGDITDNHGAADGWVVYLANDLAVDENSFATIFQFYPNPTKNLINITVDPSRVGAAFIVYDHLFRIVKTGKFEAENSVIQLEDLSKGVYLLHSNNLHVKIVKD